MMDTVKQSCRRNPESLAEFSYSLQRDVFFATFNTTQMVAVHPDEIGERFLRELL